MKAELLLDEYLKPLVSSVMWRSVPALRNHPSAPSPIPGSRPGRNVAQRHPLQERRLPEPGGPDLPRASAQPGSRDAVSKEGQLVFFACSEISAVFKGNYRRFGPGSAGRRERFRSVPQDTDTIKSSDKICRQLIYHLTPHSRWLRQSMSRRKSQAW